MKKILVQTKLVISNQAAFLAQVAQVYANFYRAAMEYVDNVADAAATMRQADPSFVGALLINVDIPQKTVTFTDNVGGMSPQILSNLLSKVGDSTKKTQKWTNGQFGFGIQSFRGFARYADFLSMLSDGSSASIRIDASANDDASVAVLAEPKGSLKVAGTRVTISGFRSHVFQRAFFAQGLVAEIQQHFDDVLRSGLMTVSVSTNGAAPSEVTAFDFESLPGDAVRESLQLEDGSVITVNIRVCEKLQEEHQAMLTSKGRRIQNIADLRSYKSYAKAAGRSVQVWQNPFVVGLIEIGDAVNPNLTRDDLREGEARNELYSLLLKVQLQVEEILRERLEKKKEDEYSKLGEKMSECLANILRQYRLRFEHESGNAAGPSSGVLAGSTQPFGGLDTGGGGPGPDGVANNGNRKGEGGESGPGKADSGGGVDGPSTADRSNNPGGGGSSASAPQIKLAPFPSESSRVIPFGSTLTVNTAHADFASRQPKGSRVTSRMVGYVAQVVAGPCVEFLYAKRGRPLVAAAVAEQVADISIALEGAFTESGVLEELYSRAGLPPVT